MERDVEYESTQNRGSWWPAILVVALLLLGGWALLNRATLNDTANITSNSSYGVGGAPPDMSETVTPMMSHSPTGATGPTGYMDTMNSTENSTMGTY